MHPSQVSTKTIENIDQDILHEIAQVRYTFFEVTANQKFAVDADTVLEALKQGEKTGEVNEFLVAYHLIYDNKRMYTGKHNWGQVNSCYRNRAAFPDSFFFRQLLWRSVIFYIPSC